MKLKINGSWTQFTEPLSKLEPFTTHGALHGRPGNASGWAVGRLPEQYRTSVYHADYVVYSYATPIAWHVPNRNEGWKLGNGEPAPAEPGWVMPDEKYSVTTSKHQGHIFTAISQLRGE